MVRDEEVGLVLQEDGRVATRSPEELMAFAKKVAQMDDWCPRAYRGNPAALIMAWEHGAELGFSKLQAQNAIAIVEGRPTIYGDAGTALVMQRGLVSGYEESWSGAPYEDDWTAMVNIKRLGVDGSFPGSFSLAEARRAKLYPAKEGAAWQKYTRDMLLWRAKWRAYKSGFADHLKGLVFREVVGDYSEPRDVTDTVQSADIVQPVEAAPAPDPQPESAPPPGENPFDGWEEKS